MPASRHHHPQIISHPQTPSRPTRPCPNQSRSPQIGGHPLFFYRNWQSRLIVRQPDKKSGCRFTSSSLVKLLGIFCSFREWHLVNPSTSFDVVARDLGNGACPAVWFRPIIIDASICNSHHTIGSEGCLVDANCHEMQAQPGFGWDWQFEFAVSSGIRLAFSNLLRTNQCVEGLLRQQALNKDGCPAAWLSCIQSHSSAENLGLPAQKYDHLCPRTSDRSSLL